MPTLIARPHPLRSDLYRVELPDGSRLSDILPANDAFHAQANGEPWSLERWGDVLPDGTIQVVAVTPQDDDILGAVLMVAVAVAAAYTGGAAAGAAGSAGWGSAGVTAAQVGAAAAVSIAGSLAVNAIVQPKTPSPASQSGGSTVRNSLTGTQNRANPYGVIPRVYGNPRWFPPLAGNPVTESAGDDQYLRMLLCLGYGPLEVAGHRVGPGLPLLSNASVGNAIRIGETNLGEYEEVDWEIGTADQLTLYTQDIAEEAVGAALNVQLEDTDGGPIDSHDNVVVTRRTAVDATEISLDIVWLSGLYALGTDGALYSGNVEITIEQRAVGDTNWTMIHDVTVSSSSKNTIRKNWRWEVAKGQYDVRVTRVRTTARGSSALVTDAQWSVLRTIQGDNPAYGDNRHVLMALRIKATDQLNGVVDQLSIRTQAVLRTWTPSGFQLHATNNPAWSYLNAMTGEQVQRPIDDGQINLPEIQAWANFCDEAGLGYSWVHDAPETLFQRLKAIASTGQGSFSMQDGLYGIVRDSPSDPITQMITPRNSWGLKSSRQFQKLPHAIRVSYVDFETGAATGTDAEVIVYRDGYDASNATIFEDFETQGVTSAEEAAFQGNYYMRQAVLRPETFSVEMDWENLAAVRGNRCSLASDVLKVGLASARIVAVDDVANTVTLDSEVEYTKERAYGMRVRRQDGEQVVVPVTASEIGYAKTLSFGDEAYGLSVGDLVTYGELTRETIDTKIQQIEPGPDFTASLTLVPAAVDIYDFASDPIYDPGITNPINPADAVPPVPVITSARGDSTASSRNPDGSFRTLIRVSYIFPVQIGVPTLQVEARYRLSAENEWQHAGPFPAVGTLSISQIDLNSEYVIQIRARNRDRVSAWSNPATIDVSGQAVVMPTGVDVEIGTFSVTLRPQSVFANSQFEYFRSEVELQPSAVEANAVRLGTGTVMVDPDLQPDTEYWYYVRMYTVNAVSGFYTLNIKTRNDFDAIIGAVDEDLRKPGGIVDQFENDIGNLDTAIEGVRTDVDAATDAANSALADASTALQEAQDALDAANGANAAVDQAQQAADEALANARDAVDVAGQANSAVADVRETADGAAADASAAAAAASAADAKSEAAQQQAVDALQRAQDALNSIDLVILEEQVQRAALSARISGANASVDVERTVRIAEDQALAQQIITLQAELGESVATLTQRLTALATTTDALSELYTGLRAEFDDATAAFEQQISALASQTESVVQSVESLRAEYDESVAQFEQRITTLADETQALATRSSELESSVEDVNARVAEEETTRASETEALASQAAELRTEFEDNAASVSNELTTLSDDQRALASDVSEYQAATDGRIATAEESITVLTDDTQALAQQSSELRSDVDENSALVSENAQTIVLNELAQATINAALQVRNTLGAAAIDVERVVRIDEDRALATLITTLETTFNDASSSYEERITSLSEATQALTEQLVTLRSEYDDNSAAVELQLTALVTTTQSITETLETLRSEYDDSTASANQQLIALADETQALSQSLTELQGEVGDNAAAIVEEARVRADAVSALSSTLAGLSATVGDNYAEFEQTRQTLTDEQQALSQALDNLSAEFEGETSEISQRVTALVNDVQSVADLVTTLRSDFDDATAGFDSRITTLADETQALTQTTDALMAAIDDAAAQIEETRQTIALNEMAQAVINTALQARNSLGASAVDVERISRVDEYQALAQIVTQLEAAFGDANASYEERLTALSTATQALTQQLATLSSDFEDNSASVNQQLSALVTTTQSITESLESLRSDFDDNAASVDSRIIALADDQSATAGELNTFRAEVEGDFAEVRQEVSAVYDPETGAVAQAVTTVNVNGVRGVLGIQVQGEEAQIIGIADKFAIFNEISGELVTAFVVSDGRVIMPEAFIDTLTITKLRSSTGSLVFEDDRLQAAYIAVEDLVVKRGQSDNFESGVSGWQLNPDGGEINFPVRFANDTQGVDGRPAWEVRLNAEQANGRITEWTRPTSTLIDGNKIATGYAYVDTLEIKGQAVTIPVSTAASSAVEVYDNVSGVDILQASIDAQGANVMLMCSFGASSITSNGYYRVEIWRGGTLVIARPGTIGAFSVSAHVGAESGTSIFTVVAIGNNVRIGGRSLGLLATRR